MLLQFFPAAPLSFSLGRFFLSVLNYLHPHEALEENEKAAFILFIGREVETLSLSVSV
jgi:hypothetical protein